MKKKKHKQRGIGDLRIIVGTNAYRGSKNDYAGLIGMIEWCGDCCQELRVQFIKIGNNEPLRNFNLDRCRFFQKT